MEKQTIQKPIDLVILDVKKELANVLNGSNLPLTVMQMILSEMSFGINKQCIEYEREYRAKYESVLQQNEINNLKLSK